jgi:predicted nucleic acid-binding protein
VVSSDAPYLDTNVIIRFLTSDDLPRQEAAAVMFEELSNRRIALKTLHSVFAEAVFVLSSKRLYGLSRGRIVELLAPIASLPNLRIAQRPVLLRAFELFGATSLHFVDALLAAAAEGTGGEVCSFDEGFDRIASFNRVDPAAFASASSDD